MNKEYCVYVHTNNINQKKYVGVTSLAPNLRWHNGDGYKTQTKFYADIEKYGWHNFSHEIVFTTTSKEEAYNKEKELIAKYNSISCGYNSNGKSVYCVELQREFISIAQASAETKVDASTIAKVCKGQRKSAGKHPITQEKLHWQYI